MKLNIVLTITFFSALLFTSCEVEFSPNDNWRETPVVYCLLDQDDDTTYVRVQRCFLGEGNQYSFAAEKDSNNYPEGAISVSLEEWRSREIGNGVSVRDGAAPLRVFNFEYCEKGNKDEGIFYSSLQPVYKYATGGLLDTSNIYRLVVVKTSTGDTIATSQTRLIRGEMELFNPNNVTLFNFSGVGVKSCEIKWSALTEARRYQPVVRFFYRDFIVDQSVIPFDTTIIPHSVDIVCNSLSSDMRRSSYSIKLGQDHFLSTIKEYVGDNMCNKNVIDTVQIFINCCTEPLSAYMYASSPTGSINQDPFIYTNIEGGLGVFAARRCHIDFWVGTPKSSIDSYKKALHDLGIGF